LLAALGHAYALAGEREKAEKAVSELAELSRSRYVSAYSVALVHVSLENTDEAFHWLDRACEERAIGLTHLTVEVDLDPVRSDPRFARLRDCVGL
jgi:hypothetical protein